MPHCYKIADQLHSLQGHQVIQNQTLDFTALCMNDKCNINRLLVIWLGRYFVYIVIPSTLRSIITIAMTKNQCFLIVCVALACIGRLSNLYQIVSYFTYRIITINVHTQYQYIGTHTRERLQRYLYIRLGEKYVEHTIGRDTYTTMTMCKGCSRGYEYYMFP